MTEKLPDTGKPRCKQCDHLVSFHSEDGCGTWLLGVRAVPLYRCACVVSVSDKPKLFPKIQPTLNPFGSGIGQTPQPLRINSIGYSGSSFEPYPPPYQAQNKNTSRNPEDSLQNLSNRLSSRPSVPDNQYTEFERQEIISHSNALNDIIESTIKRYQDEQPQ